MHRCNDWYAILNTKKIKASRRISMTLFNQWLVILFAVLGSVALPSSTQARLNSQLTVEVDGLRNRQGQVCLSLFASGRGFPSNGADAVQKRCMAITAMPLLVTFENLQPGSYAVAVLHDTNSDNKANRNALGIPLEGFGFSGNPVIQTGPPRFNDAAVLVAGPRTNIQIQLNYLLGGSSTPQQRINAEQRQATPSKNGANQIIKVRLRVSGPDNEWIRIETSANGTGETVLRAYHTTRVRKRLLSGLASGLLSFGAEELASEVIDGYDGPVPLPGINFYRWADHKTRRLAFVPDSCSGDSPAPLEKAQPSERSSCAITGTDSLTLSAGTDIHAGLLTIEYAEEDLVRSLTFRVPKKRS